MTFSPNGKNSSDAAACSDMNFLIYQLFKYLRSPDLSHLSYYTGKILIKYVLICISIDSLVWFQNHLILYSTLKNPSMYHNRHTTPKTTVTTLAVTI